MSKRFILGSSEDGLVVVKDTITNNSMYLTIEDATNLVKTTLLAIRDKMNSQITAINSLEEVTKEATKIPQISDRFVDIVIEGE